MFFFILDMNYELWIYFVHNRKIQISMRINSISSPFRKKNVNTFLQHLWCHLNIYSHCYDDCLIVLLEKKITKNTGIWPFTCVAPLLKSILKNIGGSKHNVKRKTLNICAFFIFFYCKNCLIFCDGKTHV